MFTRAVVDWELRMCVSLCWLMPCFFLLSINVIYHHKVNLKEGLLTARPPCKSQKYLFWIHQMGELLFPLYFFHKKHYKRNDNAPSITGTSLMVWNFLSVLTCGKWPLHLTWPHYRCPSGVEMSCNPLLMIKFVYTSEHFISHIQCSRVTVGSLWRCWYYNLWKLNWMHTETSWNNYLFTDALGVIKALEWPQALSLI